MVTTTYFESLAIGIMTWAYRVSGHMIHTPPSCRNDVVLSRELRGEGDSCRNQKHGTAHEILHYMRRGGATTTPPFGNLYNNDNDVRCRGFATGRPSCAPTAFMDLPIDP